MSAQAQTPPPKSARSKQRPKRPDKNHSHIEGRQLEPYFDDSVAGMALEPQSENKRKTKPKSTRPKANHHGPNKPNLRPSAALLQATIPAEQGYHSESGTAHYMQDTRNRSVSGSHLNPHTSGGIESVNGHKVGPSSIEQTTATPTKQVYAGPNFLASPAASALPMPKAFAKNLPSTSNPSSIDSPDMQLKRPESTPLKSTDQNVDSLGREGSPLDFLFNADRAEKLQKASNCASPLSTRKGQLNTSPPLPLSAPNRDPAPAHDAAKLKPAHTSKEKLFQEIDGTDEQSDTVDSEEGPHPLPYQQRINALCSQPDSATAAHTTLSPRDNIHESSTQALKQLLFDSASSRSAGSYLTPMKGRKAASVDIKGASPSAHRSLASPVSNDPGSTLSQHPRPRPGHGVQGGQRLAGTEAPPPPPDIKMMEDNLRRVLNIGS